MLASHGNARGLAIVLALASLAGCSGDQQADGTTAADAAGEGEAMSVIEGEVSYRERIMLPPGAELEVQLEDISRADAMATVITTVSYTLDGAPPYPFTIEYDPTRIDPRMRYALRARITEGGELRFTNTEYIDPFAAPPVKVMVAAVARAPAPEVEDEAETAPAESVDDGEQTAGDTGADSAQQGAVVWILETLEGETAPLGSRSQPIELQLDAAESRVAGFSGCNRYSGGFSGDGKSTHGTPIKFGPMAGTLMACPDGGDTERRYLQALGRVDAYRMEGEKLVLLSGADVVATYNMR